MATYLPPADPGTRQLLGKIVDGLQSGSEVDRTSFRKQQVEIITRLPGGQIYIDCGLNVDDDGETSGFPEGWVPGIQPTPNCPAPCKSSHQNLTSYTMASGAPLNSNRIPYIVLPGRCKATPDKETFWEQAGVRIGDGVTVIWRGRLVHAVFGDEGPCDELGEASLETIRNIDPNWRLFDTSKTYPVVVTTRNEAHPGNRVVLIVFPGTRQGDFLSSLQKFQTSLNAAYEALRNGAC